jgi:hypothetical protein
MEVTPPFAYEAIIPLERRHRVKLPAPGETPAFCRTLNALPLSFAEFPRAAFHYPIVFIGGGAGRYLPVAVIGLEPGQNLFIDEAGSWEPGIYVPAYVRRYPFCMAKTSGSERVVCIEKKYLDEAGGEPLFNDQGEALPHWRESERLLQEYESDLMRTEELCDILAKFRLLAPFTLQAMTAGGEARHLDGMHRVEEKKLEFLTSGQYKTLMKKGAMGRIYTHLLSLDNFGRLLDRYALRHKKQ